ncbi:MAG TPA: carboxypeptidase-like regulatory domain-containing protein [Luteitalea sp.]|nr:carboxypeptidase-like regulatory domain-containing protein [Luteitalea sp.]
MTKAVLLTLCLFVLTSLARAQMPDLRQMSGVPLPSPDLPDGSVSVRVVRQSLGNNVSGAQVTLAGAASQSAATDAGGRAIFSGVTPGTTLTATVVVDGETVRSQPFPMPASGGVRLILAAGLQGGGQAGSSGAAPGGVAAPTVPAAPAVPARPGSVVFGNQTRTILDFSNEQLEVFHLFEIANVSDAPVAVPQPLTIAMPDDAVQVTLLEGSSPQARVFERSLVIAGPFAPGRTIAQIGYRLPISGPRREFTLKLPVASMATNVILRRLGDTKLVEPSLPQSREAEAEGRKYFTGTGPGMAAGAELRIAVDGLPNHPRWPRYTALGLAGLIVAGGLYAIFFLPVSPATRIAALEAQRTDLLGRLQRIDGAGAGASEDREGILRDLEGIYALLDAERARSGAAADAANARRAS